MNKLLSAFFAVVLFIFSASAAQAVPELSMPSQIPAEAGTPVTVPVNFVDDGNAITSTAFSVDFDEINLSFDPTDANADGIPDSITMNAPAAFIANVTFDAGDTDGEIDIGLFSFSATLPDGLIASITFTARNVGSTTVAAVNFSQDPVATFGNTLGQDVPGTTVDGSVQITPVCNPTGTSETVCNGIDDDCDGSVDEDFQPQATTCGVGECAATGQAFCNSDGTTGDTCTPGTPSAEVCDNLDNDCDGSTDEDYVADTSCYLPGACAALNTPSSCTDGIETACSTGTPSAEVCEGGVDENCDGQVDENCDCADGDTRESSCGVGACAATGIETCVNGAWTWTNNTCTPGTPAADDAVCNNIDDDCDGSTDEDYVADTSCYLPGACAALNTPSSCTDGVETACSTGTPSAEVCEGGVDENCDGEVDENCDCADGDTRESSCGVGACAATGIETCVNGAWTNNTCTPGTPAADDAVCNNIDDDCDGSTDEDYVADTSCYLPGACAALNTPSSCTDGVETACSTGIPSAEVCEGGVDENCDGQVDENCDCADGDTRETGCGVGACAATGIETCVNGAWTNNTCTPGTPAADDAVCNNIDDDCDGSTDEDYVADTSCYLPGACAALNTPSSCTDGVETACSTGIPSAEVCEGSVDENCDGQVDENCDCADGDTRESSCGVGACAAIGVETCVNGAWTNNTCTPGTPAADDAVCNNIDDDCDGSTDEDYVADTSCYLPGACAALNTPSSCTDGVETACSAGTPSAEVCEGGVDENCDGQVDENCDCADGDTRESSCGVGACAAIGVETCVNGVWTDNTCTPGTPAGDDAVCNNIDDDCDGGVDEDFQTTPTTCGVGACEGSTGQVECQSGSEIDACDPLAGAQAEGPAGDGTCSDTVDNDCDGQVDSGDMECQVNTELFDWGFNIDGTTYCLIGPCDFDVDDAGNIAGPEDLPSFIDISKFDFTAGLGSISITIADPGSHGVVMYVDHDIDADLNDFDNETGFSNGSPEMGQAWEIDEPGNGSLQDGSAGLPYFGDIFFNNFLDGMLDNQAFFDAIDDQTLTPPDDVSMAMGWDFELFEGESATIVFLLGDTSIPQGFHLVHSDPDSNANIYFSNSLNRAQDVETDCFDGVDEDGDGQTDCADSDCEGATDGSCDTGQPGICSTGITTCQSETSVCVPDNQPAAGDAACDGLDSDCDGEIDENFQTIETTCGTGVCTSTGQIECVEGQEVDSCTPGPQDETADVTCDGVDGDCDGGVDEDFQTTSTTCGVGACEGNTGRVECQSGSEVDTCDPYAGAIPEGPAGNMTCDDTLDNDCDGLTDTDDTNCERVEADVFLTKIKAPESVKIKKGRKSNIKIKAFGMTDTVAQRATVNLTVNRIDAVRVKIKPASKTKSLKPGHDPKKFKFSADISCDEPGTWVLQWEATINAEQNADTSNDTRIASTTITCEKKANHHEWEKDFRWKIKTFIWYFFKDYFTGH